ncbi:MAG: hypothetical protein RIR69_404 [Actinomycetota bacterium]|jgi:alpha-galactosidase
MTLQAPTVLAHLTNTHSSVVIAEHGGSPYVSYIGTPLSTSTIDTYLFQRGVLGGGLDVEIYPWLLPEPARGWMGRPGIQLRNATGAPALTSFQINDVLIDNNLVTIVLNDTALHLNIELSLNLTDHGPLLAHAIVTNNSSDVVQLDALRITIPVSAQCSEVLTLGGRHAMEAVEHRHMWHRSGLAFENRTGRTSHEQLGVVFTGSENFSEQHGEVFGLHLAWSGNYEIFCDSLTESLRTVSCAELLNPGEVSLAPGDRYQSPQIVVAYSSTGINSVSQQFHQYLRSTYSPHLSRPVIVNTWEAVYFNHNVDTLKNLATRAARVGAERFVLDDGWFHNRRNDTAGLGDWWVDESVWPEGLEPLISHVRALGMEFGLWWEPEMVNPDSTLFRQHPEWALKGSDQDPILGRHQLVLDMSRADVRDYLFSHMSQLLRSYNISYIKWDHNRPLVGGIAHQHTLGVYELFERLTREFPEVQFESCASGGGRIDMGIARYVHRFWTSDSIDALDRLQIQKGVSKLVPLEMMGSHIGSPTCHTTGRKHALSFRTATAMFGWLGIEWNLLSLTDTETQNLTNAISTYKKFRTLLHSGNYVRWDHPDTSMHIHGVMAHDASQAVVSVSRLHNTESHRTHPLHIRGLCAEYIYRVERVEMGTPRFALHRELPQWVTQGVSATGEQLEKIGLTLPPLLPESTMVVTITQDQP